MNVARALRAGVATAALTLVAMPALAQDKASPTTADNVRAEISEAMDAIANYSKQERDRALAEVRQALTRLDAELDRREQSLRGSWAEMSESSRESAQARLRELRAARNTLGERYGALQSGTSGAWRELKSGFSDAWDAFSEAWSIADNEGRAK